MWVRSATSRLIAIHLLLVALSTAAVLAFVYYQTRNLIQEEVQQVIGAELRGLSDDYREGGIRGLARAIERRLAADPSRDGVYLLADANGRRIVGNLGDWPPVLPVRSGWAELELYRSDHNRVAVITAATLPLADGARLLIGRDSESQTIFRKTLLSALAWALGVAGLLALASGWYLSRLVGRRVADVVSTADEIVQGDMARRVPVRGGGDEFDQLALTLNRMLDRIQTLIGDLRMVTDAVAHDLRSPLTRLRAHLDASMEDGLAEAEQHERIARAIAEADALIRTFAALMEIARAEAGFGRDQFEEVDLGQLAENVADLYAPAAAEKGVQLVLTGKSAKVAGHPQLLANAVANLIENAVFHAPSESEVRIILEDETAPSGPALTIADHGPGIPEEKRAHVLARFVRLDGARSRPGAGLGLSLVGAVARMHGAVLELADNAPGLRVSLRFDAARAPKGTWPENAQNNHKRRRSAHKKRLQAGDGGREQKPEGSEQPARYSDKR